MENRKHDYKLLIRASAEELQEAIREYEEAGWHQDGGVFLQKNIPDVEVGYSIRMKKAQDVHM